MRSSPGVPLTCAGTFQDAHTGRRLVPGGSTLVMRELLPSKPVVLV